MNVDAGYWNSNSTGEAIVAGVARDNRGQWVWGFAWRIRAKIAAVADAKALMEGIDECSKRNVARVIIHSDSRLVVNSLEQHNSRDRVVMTIMTMCKERIKDLDEARIEHCYRETNLVADQLTKEMRKCIDRIIVILRPHL